MGFLVHYFLFPCLSFVQDGYFINFQDKTYKLNK